MTRLRLIVLAGWLLMFGAGFAFGRFVTQDGNSSETTYLDRLSTQYHLTPDQIETIGGHLETERATIDQILAGVEAGVRQQIQDARKETVQKIRGSLTPDQQQQFDRDREAENQEH